MSRRDDFPALDGLRAVGALAVLLTHVAFQTGQYPRGVTGAVLARFDVGVALFFVLSGFLLSIGFLRPLCESGQRQSYRAYAIKRVLRIWPVFAVTVVLATTLIGRDTSPASWWHSLTMTHLYSTRFFTDGLTQMWSLETEIAFYAVLPFLMAAIGLLLRRTGWSVRPVLLSLGLLVAISWVWLGYGAAQVQPSRPFVYQWLPGFLSWFACGIAMAVIWVHATRDASSPARVPALISKLAANPGALWSLALSALLIASTPIAGPLTLAASTESAGVAKNAIYAVVAVLIVLPAVFGPPDDVFHRVFSWPPVRYLGHISYAVFCIHLIVLWYVMEAFDYELFTGSFVLVAATTIVASIAAAVVLYHVVERPAMRLARRLVSGMKAPGSTTDKAASVTS